MKTEEPDQANDSNQPCRDGALSTNGRDARRLKPDAPAVDVEAFELDDIEEIESKVFA